MKKKTTKLIFAFILIFLIINCKNTTKVNEKNKDYFDLTAWMQHSLRCSDIKNEKYKVINYVNKTISESNDFEKQIEMACKYIQKYDLNKAENKGLYRIISVSNGNNYYVNYVPLKKNFLRTNKMKVILTKNNVIKEIYLVNKLNTGVYDATKYISLRFDTINHAIASIKIENKRAFLFTATDSIAIVFNQIKNTN